MDSCTSAIVDRLQTGLSQSETDIDNLHKPLDGLSENVTIYSKRCSVDLENRKNELAVFLCEEMKKDVATGIPMQTLFKLGILHFLLWNDANMYILSSCAVF